MAKHFRGATQHTVHSGAAKHENNAKSIEILCSRSVVTTVPHWIQKTLITLCKGKYSTQLDSFRK